ncbi:MAG: tetratricopeptide repeat protein, partial [Fibrobacter sp.]|nr:tetratricopeptide repeat protein [Fibrobacter sp.]
MCVIGVILCLIRTPIIGGSRATAGRHFPFVFGRLAWAHEKAGALDEARAEYRRIAAKWPKDPVAGEA